MSETVFVTLGGEQVSVAIEGGNLAAGASLVLVDLNDAAKRAEQAASDAEAAAAGIPAMVAGLAERDGSNALASFVQNQPYMPAGLGAVIRTVDDKLKEQPVSPYDFYQVADVDDWAPAFNRAFATGLNVEMPERVGGYLVKQKMVIQSDGQRLITRGSGNTYFKIDSASFNMAETAVLEFAATITTGRSVGISGGGLGFEFVQPDTAIRGALTVYPPAIKCDGVPRINLGTVRISGASHGISAKGNVGGMTWDLLEIGAFVEGIALGGVDGADPALDFVDGLRTRFWPYGLEGSRLTPYRDGVTVGLRAARVDGLNLVEVESFTPRIMIQTTAGEGPFGSISSLSLDGRGARLDMDGGSLKIGTWYKTTEVDGDYAFKLNGGFLVLGPGDIAVSHTGTQSAVVNNGGYLVAAAGGVIRNCSSNAALFENVVGPMTVKGWQFLVGSNTTRTTGFIKQTSGPMIATDNFFPPIGTGAGPCIYVSTNDVNIFEPNVTNGWTITAPPMSGGTLQGLYGPNAGQGAVLVQASPATLNVIPDYKTYQLNAGADMGTISGGSTGDVINFVFGGTVSFVAGGNIHPDQNDNVTYRAGDTTSYQCLAGQWYEKGRSRNTAYVRPPRVTAAADPLTLVATDRVVKVTGNLAAIGTITAGVEGQEVTLVFTGVTAVVGNTATTKLNGGADFSTGPRYTLGLYYDGTYWVERFRSANV